MPLLRVDKQAHEARRVLLENPVVLRVDAFVLADEAVELLGPSRAPPREEPAHDAALLLLDGFEMKAVHQLVGALEDVAGVPVVVAHERLDALQDALVAVAEVGGDDALEPQGEHVLLALLDVVQLRAHSQEEVIRLRELAQRGRREHPGFHEVAQVGRAQLGVGGPEEVVIVAQAAAAGLHVGLLHERRHALLVVALDEVLPGVVSGTPSPFPPCTRGRTASAVPRTPSGFTGDEPGLDERGLHLVVLVGPPEGFAHGAGRRVADFEPAVPQRRDELRDHRGRHVDGHLPRCCRAGAGGCPRRCTGSSVRGRSRRWPRG